MKKMIGILLCAALLTALACPALAAGPGFTDLPDDHWAREAVYCAEALGVVYGYPDGSFQPDGTVSAAHFAAMLSRACFPGEYGAEPADGPWYKPYVELLEAKGVLKKTSLSRGPAAIDQPICRYDMAMMLANTLQARGQRLYVSSAVINRAKEITDWETMPSDYAAAVAICYSLELLKGYPDGSFQGDHPMTRAEGCTVILRLLTYLDGPRMELDPHKAGAATEEELRDLNANMELRMKLVELINEVRVANGVEALPVEQSLMDAAQDCSAQMFTYHSRYELEALQRHGWMFGGGINLTGFTFTDRSAIASQAVENWQNSPPHFQSMVDGRMTCIGVGITLHYGHAYCYLMLGDPNAHSSLDGYKE